MKYEPTNLKQYVSHKKIQAEPMTKFDAITLGLVRDTPEILPNMEDELGFYILYENGYESWSPRDVFLKGNSPLDKEFNPDVTTQCNFTPMPIETAEERLLARYNMANASFKKCLQKLIDSDSAIAMTTMSLAEKGEYVVIKRGYPQGVPSNKEAMFLHDIPLNTKVIYEPYLELKTSLDTYTPLVLLGRMVTEDWIIM